MLRFVCCECILLCCVAYNIYSEMIIIWCIHRYVCICMPWCGLVYCKVCIVCQQYMWSVPVRLFTYFALPYFVFASWMLFKLLRVLTHIMQVEMYSFCECRLYICTFSVCICTSSNNVVLMHQWRSQYLYRQNLFFMVLLVCIYTCCKTRTQASSGVVWYVWNAYGQMVYDGFCLWW